MPKIEVPEQLLYGYLGSSPTDEELERMLANAKGELDDHADGVLKIELNDTNRPDLWSTTGVVRQLKTEERRTYEFLSTSDLARDAGDRIVDVDPGLREIRPYIAAFVARGKAVDDALLVDIIQSQEKLCGNFGSRRKSVAMGVYRAEAIEYPVRYEAADPDTTRFTPLGMDEELDLRRILEEHPKGVEFGWIVKDMDRYPFLRDARGGVLSFPPIINSAEIGEVVVGDDNFFVELTGPEMDVLLLAANVAACDLCDMGFEILPVMVRYPYDTPHGREVTTPLYFQEPATCDVGYASRLLGVEINSQEAVGCLERAGLDARTDGDTLVVTVPPYRNDFLHPVDVVEEIMIGRGMDSFEPVWPSDFTVGKLSATEEYSRRVADIMVGLGYQEMVYNYLGSRQDLVEKMHLSPGDADADVIEIANPMTASYEIVRRSILPNLLGSESVSGHAAYPHAIFEIGKTARKDATDAYGSVTRDTLGFFLADGEAGFNEVGSHLAALLYYLGREYLLEEAEDPRFIPGRSGTVMHRGEPAGVIGEIRPEVLVSFGIQMPCAAVELDLNLLMEE